MNLLPIVGVCGGIASGKSEVSRLFRKAGGCLIDADKIAHQVLQSQAVRKNLLTCYGRKILNARGRIDNTHLADIIFRTKRNVNRLNELVHPIIRKRVSRIISNLHNNKSKRYKFIILDAALLVETGLGEICNTLVFVDARKSIRRQRANLSRGWSSSELDRRERFQMPPHLKRNKANFIIDNNADFADLSRQVAEVAKFIVTLCGSRRERRKSL